MNSTSETSEEDLEITIYNIALSTFSFVMMVFVSTGNTLTLLAIAKTPVLRTQANMYVASLAIADLYVGLGFSLTGIFMLPPLKNQYFDHQLNLCVFMQGSIIGNLVTSSNHMTLISFDRYVYITRPYVYPRLFTKRNITVFLTGIWIFGISMIITPQFVYNDNTTDCDLLLTLPLWYILYLTSFLFLINVIIACTFYSQILFAAVKQRKAIHATTATVGKLDSGETADINNGNKRKSSIRSSKVAWKSIKFFFTIFGFYFVCMTPCFVAISFDAFSTINEDLVRAMTLVVMLNSGMNFVIYAVLNKQFKRAFSDILRCRPSSQ